MRSGGAGEMRRVFARPLSPHLLIASSPYRLISLSPHLLIASSPYPLISLSPHLPIPSSPYPLISLSPHLPIASSPYRLISLSPISLSPISLSPQTPYKSPYFCRRYCINGLVLRGVPVTRSIISAAVNLRP
jgi:hypothetical protein